MLPFFILKASLSSWQWGILSVVQYDNYLIVEVKKEGDEGGNSRKGTEI